MKIIIEIGHPGHVHQFRKVISKLINGGHDVLVVAKKKESAIDLLKFYKIKHKIIGKNYKNLVLKLYSLLMSVINLFIIARNFSPDLFISRVSPTSSFVSLLRGSNHIAFNDTEHCTLTDKLALPFCHKVITPMSFSKDLGENQISYNSFTEMFYVSDLKKPLASKIYNKLGINSSDKITLLRFVSWSAAHDIGFKGISIKEKVLLVKYLSQYSKVFISSESKLPSSLKSYSLKTNPSEFHDVLGLSSLYVGDGATTASEAALMGVPSIYTNPIELGYIDELERKKLLFQELTFNKIIRRSSNIIKSNYNRETERLSKILRSNLVDPVEFSMSIIENQNIYEK